MTCNFIYQFSATDFASKPTIFVLVLSKRDTISNKYSSFSCKFYTNYFFSLWQIHLKNTNSPHVSCQALNLSFFLLTKLTTYQVSLLVFFFHSALSFVFACQSHLPRTPPFKLLLIYVLNSAVLVSFIKCFNFTVLMETTIFTYLTVFCVHCCPTVFSQPTNIHPERANVRAFMAMAVNKNKQGYLSCREALVAVALISPARRRGWVFIIIIILF